MCWDVQIVQVSGTRFFRWKEAEMISTSKSLESSVKYPTKILGIHNVPKHPKRIQKACSCMSLSTCFMKQNLPTEPFPWWFLEVFIPGLYRLQSTHPMLARATSCKIVRPWFHMILLQKLRRRNPLKHGIHTLLADAQLNWTSILLKFGYHRSSVLLREERLRVLWCRTRLNRQRRAGMRWLTCRWPFGMLAGILKNPESKYFTHTDMLSYLNKGLKNTHATARCRETYSYVILTLKRRLILLYIVWHDNTNMQWKKSITST